MRIDTLTPAVSVANAQPPMGATADSPQHAGDRDAPADRGEQFGPLTSSDMAAAGGPFNKWDADIAAAHRRGNHQLARRLQDARARINIHLLQRLEPVWVPSPHQRLMLALRNDAVADGFEAVAA